MTHAHSSPTVDSLPSDLGQRMIHHLYAHIPFCPVKCDYCAFVTHIGSDKLIGRYIAALQSEAMSQAARGLEGPLETIYLGGGTPSMLAPDQISHLLETFRASFGFAWSAEITMEAHPATVDSERLAGYRRAGVNRISFGVESLVPRELRALGRIAGERVPTAALSEARGAGFDNIAMDLMYGIPLQTSRSWAETLDRMLEYRPDHLSLYPLSIEPKTVFQLRQKRHELELPDDDRVVEMYSMACEILASAGYQHYEVGSWCLAGRQCRHNLACWRNREYVGLGVGAHGYVRAERTVNLRQTVQYIRRLEAGGDPVVERERIDADTRRIESIMLRLRLLAEGLDTVQLKRDHHWDIAQQCADALRMLSDAGLIRMHRGRIYLMESAVPVANDVWERLAV